MLTVLQPIGRVPPPAPVHNAPGAERASDWTRRWTATATAAAAGTDQPLGSNQPSLLELEVCWVNVGSPPHFHRPAEADGKVHSCKKGWAVAVVVIAVACEQDDRLRPLLRVQVREKQVVHLCHERIVNKLLPAPRLLNAPDNLETCDC
jgi:hypothetical protein